MERQFSTAGGRGTLRLREEGPRAVLEAELPDDGRGLYKAYLTGMGPRLLLGTLMPEGGALRLRRTLTVDELRRKGVWPPEGAQVELAYQVGGEEQGPPRGWAREPHPERRMEDDLLERCARGLEGALARREAAGFSLALPYAPGSPFPLAPAFCLAGIERLGRELYAVFAFDGRGWPIPWNKARETGQTKRAQTEEIRA